jgi:hypothetical protein
MEGLSFFLQKNLPSQVDVTGFQFFLGPAVQVIDPGLCIQAEATPDIFQVLSGGK